MNRTSHQALGHSFQGWRMSK